MFDTLPGASDATIDQFRIMIGKTHEMESRSGEFGQYYVQNEIAAFSFKNRIEQLKKSDPQRFENIRIPELRTSLAAIDNTAAFYPSEQMCLEQLRGAQQREGGLLETPEFKHSIDQLLGLSGNEKPVALVWISGKTLANWLGYYWYTLNLSTHKAVWASQLENQQQKKSMSVFEMATKSSLIENKFDQISEKNNPTAPPICGAVFDYQSGLKAILFQPKHSKKTPLMQPTYLLPDLKRESVVAHLW